MTDTPETLPREALKMETRKPVWIHNWRTLLVELAIVVVGVCLALAAQQAVEMARHRADVRDMTEKLGQESLSNLEVLAHNIAQAQVAVAALDQAIDALSKTGPAPAILPNDTAIAILGPSDSAWQAIQFSALLPIMPKPLLANHWKVQFTNSLLIARGSDFLIAYRQAEAALRIFTGAAPTQSMRESLLLRLADAAQIGRAYISLAQRYRIQLQWALDGKEINLSLVRSLQSGSIKP